ncbi:hypothetical protein CWO89_40240 [Bradyrhizobium sp. Leo170]|nr:hypothetical protein CWO89_40240 [Bradyrhizobium sp. Leo170]
MVEVQDGDQVKTGSSVIDVAYSIQPDQTVNLGGQDTNPTPVGYAPTVDLGEKGLLFLTFANAPSGPEYRTQPQPADFMSVGRYRMLTLRSLLPIWNGHRPVL